MSGNINAFSDFAKMAQSLFFLAFSIKYHIQMIAQTYRFILAEYTGKEPELLKHFRCNIEFNLPR